VGNKRHMLAIRLITDLLVAVARPETSLVSGGGRVVAARLLGIRRGSGWSGSSS
jgi:hypothetical protein